MRLAVGPSSAWMVATTSGAGSSPSLFCALAAALAITLATGSLADCGAHRRMSRASSTLLPRTRSMTRRALLAEIRTKRAFAVAEGYSIAVVISLHLCSSRERSSPLRFPVILDVTLERAGGRELAQLVPDHRLGDEHRDMLATVVHGEGVPDEVGDDGRSTGPGLDDLLGVLLVLDVDLLEEMVVDERALLQAAWHRWVLLALVLAGAPAADDELVARLVRLAGAALGLAPRVERVATTGGLALTTAVRMV